jgi:hypothetical protein
MKDYVFKLIDRFTEGVDTYYNNGSMWLIFTDRKKWVIELTEDGTLWYNYYFFQDCFKYLSLDVFENQHYITEWVEDTIQNRVLNTLRRLQSLSAAVEDTIQNGVKHTEPGGYLGSIEMKGKIVHQLESPKQNEEVEDVIENGVRKIEGEPHDYPHTVANIIKNGVKHTEYGDWEDGDERFDDIIKNGIKETRLEQNITEGEIDDIIQDGVKLTNCSSQIDGSCVVEDVIQNGIKETWGYEKQPQTRINDVIQTGKKI